MHIEIRYDPQEPLQVIELPDGKQAFIVDPDMYHVIAPPFPKVGTVILERKGA